MNVQELSGSGSAGFDPDIFKGIYTAAKVSKTDNK